MAAAGKAYIAVTTAASVLVAAAAAFLIWFTWPGPSQTEAIRLHLTAPFLKQDTLWADSVLRTMSPGQKAAQLIMIAMDSIPGNERSPANDLLMHDVQPGGVYFTGRSWDKQSSLMQGYSSSNGIPLMKAVSAELGFYSLTDTMTGANLLPGISCISDDTLITQLAANIALQLKAAGILINIAPSFDFLDRNRDDTFDPSYRLFIDELTRKAMLYMQKLQENGIFACASSFPDYSIRELNGRALAAKRRAFSDTLRTGPFHRLADAGLSGILVRHAPEIPADSLEYSISDSLHAAFSFDGMVLSDFTHDTYNKKKYRPGEAELKALRSGSDMVLISEHFKEVYEFLLKAVLSKDISPAELDLKVKKILLAKSWGRSFAASKKDGPYMAGIKKEASLLARQVLQSSLILLTNRNSVIPLQFAEESRIASLCIGTSAYPDFERGLGHFDSISCFCIAPDASEKQMNALAKKLGRFNFILAAVYSSAKFVQNAQRINSFLRDLGGKASLIVAHFGPNEELALLDRFPVMIQSYSMDAVSQDAVAQGIFGGAAFPARLPYTISPHYCYNDGCGPDSLSRLRFGVPEEAGIPSESLYKIDSVIKEAIGAGAFPGCQVFIARKGVVVLNKSYGYHSYNDEIRVRNDDLYDIASVTKAAAATLAMMALYDQKKIELDSTLDYYFTDLDRNARGKKVRDSKLNYITVRQLMTHTSGLPAGLPIARFISPKWYLKYMMELERRRMEQEAGDTSQQEEELSPEWMIDTARLAVAEDSIFRWLFSKKKDKDHSVPLGEDFYMRALVIDSIWQLAKQTFLRRSRNYLYSDMNFYLVMKVIEAVTEDSIDNFVSEYYYRPLHLKHICYNPLEKFDKERIVPTEEEKIFRKQLVHGHVHDPTAALLGGISGNAGLFASAEDLGVLMQMLLNGGAYGGRRYLKKETVRLFTSAQEGVYRGLGWDHQTTTGIKMLAPGASPATYGHTGFTGTCVWVDPKNEIVYVFLSNRVNPSSSNQKINGMRVRQRVQQLIYDAILPAAEKMEISRYDDM